MLDPTDDRFSSAKLTGKMKNISTALAAKLSTPAPKQLLAANLETTLDLTVMKACDQSKYFNIDDLIKGTFSRIKFCKSEKACPVLYSKWLYENGGDSWI